MIRYIQVLHWVPRILCIAAIFFISLFALDAFDSDLSLKQQLGAFLLHLIPSFILTALLAAAWKWERIGGIIFILIGLAFSPIIFTHNYNMNHSIGMSLGIIASITLPFIVVGVLFVMSYYRKIKNHIS